MNRNIINKYFFWLLFALLAFPLILNGYPILFSDTATYIASYTSFISFLNPPLDRPLGYGFFIFLSSIGKSSLFYVALFQDFIMAYLISKVFNIDNFNFSKILLLIYLPISYVAILANTIEPDIWLSIGYLSAYVLIFTDKYKSPFFYILIFCNTVFAPANGLIILFSVLFLWLFIGFNKNREVALIILTIISSIFLLCFDNYISYGSFSPIEDSNTFFIGRLIGDGLAQKQINELCNEKYYKNTQPCTNRYQYIDRKDEDFMWGNYKNNFNPWNTKYQKFFGAAKTQTLIHRPIVFSYNLFKSGLETLTEFPDKLSDLYGGMYNKKSYVYIIIRKYFNSHAMMSAWQQVTWNSFNYFKLTNLGIFVVLFFALIINLGYIKENFRSFCVLSIYTFSCIFINAFIDGGLSMVNSRFNVKGLGVIIIIYCFILTSRGFSIATNKWRFKNFSIQKTEFKIR